MARACKPPALLKQSGRPFLPGGTPDDRQALLDSRKCRPDKNVIKRKIPALNEQVFSGDPCGNRTHVNGVRGRCLNRLTNGPYKREAGIYLFSQAVSSQLSSAQVSLTSVFGMGTGGTSPSSTPAVQVLHPVCHFHGCLSALLERLSILF